MTLVSFDGGESDHGRASRSPIQKRAKRPEISDREVGVPQRAVAEAGVILRGGIEEVISPYAGDRESPIEKSIIHVS